MNLIESHWSANAKIASGSSAEKFNSNQCMNMAYEIAKEMDNLHVKSIVY